MKYLLSLAICLLTIGFASGQILLGKSDSDMERGFYRTYYLPDGAILKAKVIGRLQKDSVIVETRDGLVYHLSKAEAKKTGRMFSPPQVVAKVENDTPSEPKIPNLPLDQQPKFFKGSSQVAGDLMTHFSSGGNVGSTSPESGILFSVSYLYGISQQLKVGGGAGIMTVKSGSKERLYPIFGRLEYQIAPRISANLSAGYSIIPTNDFVLNAKNGLFSNAGLAFDLVGPESPYTSRVGFGLVMQQLELGRSEVIRENTFGAQRTYTQYVERSGLLRRLQISFTHAWRMPPPQGASRSASKRKGKKRR